MNTVDRDRMKLYRALDKYQIEGKLKDSVTEEFNRILKPPSDKYSVVISTRPSDFHRMSFGNS